MDDRHEPNVDLASVTQRVAETDRRRALVEEELGEEIGRRGIGQPGELVAPFPAGDELVEPVL